ncbi:hypothetical protein KKF59_01850 [Patescibacteria group bacterium]|nr:hypothetical protein [Patescibacteria group bacterium]
MKILTAFAAIALACLAGCASVIIDDKAGGGVTDDGTVIETTTDTNTGIGGGSSTTTQTETGTATGTETGTETGTATEPPVEALLIASYVPWMANGLTAGTRDWIFQFDLEAPKVTVEVASLEIRLESLTGGMVAGSKGTPYFTGLALVDPTNSSVIAGPIEISAPAGSSSAVLQFQNSFMVSAGTTVSLVLSADVSGTEDATGEFLNGAAYTYDAVMLTTMTVASNEETGIQLLPTEIAPNADLVGQAQLVQ